MRISKTDYISSIIMHILFWTMVVFLFITMFKFQEGWIALPIILIMVLYVMINIKEYRFINKQDVKENLDGKEKKK